MARSTRTEKVFHVIRVEQISFVLVILFGIMAFPFIHIPEYVQHMQYARAWIGLDPKFTGTNWQLMDGIPDNWEVTWWGGSTQHYLLDNQEPYEGIRSISIIKTNNLGAAALAQDVVVESGSVLSISVYSKGSEGAIRVWFNKIGEERWIKEGQNGFYKIPSNESWTRQNIFLTVPSDVRLVKLVLQSSSNISFDQAYLGVKKDDVLGPNLLKNPGFETDGLEEDPILWWQRLEGNRIKLRSSDSGITQSLSYANVASMISGNYAAIHQRAGQLGKNCASSPDMTSWLINYGDRFEQAGGATARELLYRLAIRLASTCPQPYAALAEFYDEHHAFDRAADLYQHAAFLSKGSALEGKYSFEEGYIQLNYTGDLDKAVEALNRAEDVTGWEGSSWYFGAASFYLGQALEIQGNQSQARAAYKRVLECKDCGDHWKGAEEALARLQVDGK